MSKFKEGDAIKRSGSRDVFVVDEVYFGGTSMYVHKAGSVSGHHVNIDGWEHHTGLFVRGETLVWNGSPVEYIGDNDKGKVAGVLCPDGHVMLVPKHALERRKRTYKVKMQTYRTREGKYHSFEADDPLPAPPACTPFGEPFYIEVPE
jgi:hypothetical protein